MEAGTHLFRLFYIKKEMNRCNRDIFHKIVSEQA